MKCTAILLTVAALLCTTVVDAARTIPTQAQLTASFNEADFVFDFNNLPGTPNKAGVAKAINLGNAPQLDQIGMSQVLFNLEPCGINAPHVHPRGSEILHVVEGEDLFVAFVEENGSKRTVVDNTISKGASAVFPQGLLHYQQNLGCKPLKFIATLNSADAGTSTITSALFKFDNEVLEPTLGSNRDTINGVRKNIPVGNPVAGRQACLKKCGLA